MSILSIFIVLLWTNGHQKEPIFALLTADCRPGVLNGYAPEYVVLLQDVKHTKENRSKLIVTAFVFIIVRRFSVII